MSSVRIFLLPLFLLIGGHCLTAQDFITGFIITNKFDSLSGKIEYHGDIQNSQEVTFVDSAGHIHKFAPFDVFGYFMDEGRLYVSKEIAGSESDEQNKQLFLEYLVDGINDLFYYRDSKGRDHYFVQTEVGEMIEIAQEEKELYINDKKYINKSTSHLGKINYAFSKSNFTRSRLQNVRVGHKDLIDLTVDYHEKMCGNREECIVFHNKQPFFTFRLYPFINVNYTSVSLNNNGFADPYTDTPFEYKVNPGLGFNLDVQLNRVSKKLFASLNSSINHLALAKDHLEYRHQGFPYEEKFLYFTTLDLTYWQNSFSIGYSLESSNNSFLSFGVSHNWLIENNIHQYQDHQLPGNIIELAEVSNEIDIYDNLIGFKASLGRDFQLFDQWFALALSYEYSFSTDVTDYFLNVSNYELTLGKHLIKK